MINFDEVFRIGRIVRTHGTRGELELLFTDDLFERGTADYLVLELDGILVPFFFSDWRYKGNESALFQFEDIDDVPHAKPLVGANAYYMKSALSDTADEGELSSIRALTGFSVSVIDGAGHRPLGIVEHVDDATQNVLLTIVDAQGQEYLIPYHDDFLQHFDLKDRTLLLQLPEGLLELM